MGRRRSLARRVRGKPAGTHVTLTLEPKNGWGPLGSPSRPIEGDYLVTRAGSGYRVLIDRGRAVECIKIEPGDIDADWKRRGENYEGNVIWEMSWLPRGKRRKRRQR